MMCKHGIVATLITLFFATVAAGANAEYTPRFLHSNPANAEEAREFLCLNASQAVDDLRLIRNAVLCGKEPAGLGESMTYIYGFSLNLVEDALLTGIDPIEIGLSSSSVFDLFRASQPRVKIAGLIARLRGDHPISSSHLWTAMRAFGRFPHLSFEVVGSSMEEASRLLACPEIEDLGIFAQPLVMGVGFALGHDKEAQSEAFQNVRVNTQNTFINLRPPGEVKEMKILGPISIVAPDGRQYTAVVLYLYAREASELAPEPFESTKEKYLGA